MEEDELEEEVVQAMTSWLKFQQTMVSLKQSEVSRAGQPLRVMKAGNQPLQTWQTSSEPIWCSNKPGRPGWREKQLSKSSGFGPYSTSSLFSRGGFNHAPPQYQPLQSGVL